VCCMGRLVERAGDEPTGVSQMQARASRSAEYRVPRPPSCARHRHKNANTYTPGTTNHTRGAREGAQRGSWGPGTLCLSAPFAQPRPPAESLQTALSSHHCLMLQRRASHKIVRSETGQLPVTFGADRWPEQATQYITKNLVLTSGLNRPHSTSQKILVLTSGLNRPHSTSQKIWC